jgi:hypothetical protein
MPSIVNAENKPRGTFIAQKLSGYQAQNIKEENLIL